MGGNRKVGGKEGRRNGGKNKHPNYLWPLFVSFDKNREHLSLLSCGQRTVTVGLSLLLLQNLNLWFPNPVSSVAFCIKGTRGPGQPPASSRRRRGAASPRFTTKEGHTRG